MTQAHPSPRTSPGRLPSTTSSPDPVADPIRVLWLIKGLGPGGAERSLVDAAPHVDRERFRYSAAYLLPWKDHLADELRSAGVPTRCLRMRRDARSIVDPAPEEAGEGRTIDLVHAHLPSAAIGARLGLAGARRPAIISTEHNVWQRLRPMTRRLDALTFGMQDGAIAVSAAVRTSMGPRRRHPQVTVIPNGVDVSGLRSAALAGGEARARAGATAGRAGDRHRRRRDTEEGPSRVGRGGATGPRDRAGHPLRDRRVTGRRSSRCVRRSRQPVWSIASSSPGYRPKAARLMPAFDVYCLPSFYEGMPVSLLRPWHSGSPAWRRRSAASRKSRRTAVTRCWYRRGSRTCSPTGSFGSWSTRISARGSAPRARGTADGFDVRTTVGRTEALYSRVLDGRR